MNSNCSDDSQTELKPTTNSLSDVSFVKFTNLDSQATESYLYKDESFDVELIEERYDGVPHLIKEQKQAEQDRSRDRDRLDISGETSFNRSTDSIESTIDDLILKMTNTQLYAHLIDAGQTPGPVNEKTKRLYQKKANRMLKGGQQTPYKTGETAFSKALSGKFV